MNATQHTASSQTQASGHTCSQSTQNAAVGPQIEGLKMSKRFSFNPSARRIGPGIYCLEDIRQRCVIDKDSGCWRWGLSMNTAGNGAIVPRVSIPAGVLCDGRVASMAGGKAAWLLSGRRLPDGRVVWRTCGCKECINPAHLMSGTKAQEGAWIAKTGALKGGVARRIACIRNVARTQALPPSKVSSIYEEMASGVLQRDICAKHGISLSTASKINQGNHLHQRIAAGRLGLSHLGGAA